ncbi:multi-sensor hybrid histidine kinase [Planoprotostelium fungivorum]|uniref:Multi-sensor hybrid histidine kinase n=1 Tax=Planoprotostelium fungivorum TaxID=1890364 RepID=A0A2P6NXQ8_9EUKA|nr:multi-sensor hybrid histidine kinase [Planoprotostelium fungivorum]PRP88747.1 multi-sensor hybrid histidine kinase [Planoprotostelium fungivorum]
MEEDNFDELSPGPPTKRQKQLQATRAEHYLSDPKSVTLNNCDKEPIHLIGQIQGHGFLIITDSELSVQHVSMNVIEYMGWQPREMIGKPLDKFLSPFPLTYDQVKSYTQIQFKECDAEVQPKTKKQFPVHCCVHINREGLLLIECEMMMDDGFEYGLHISRIFDSFSENGDLYSVLDTVADQIKTTTGYNRVLIYEFDEEYNGRVIVEKADTDTRFLNLHFPTTDIPIQARELFRKNRFRIIQDALKATSDITPKTRAIDISMCTLRAVSQMHVTYMKNMGVRASLTISILVGVEKRLWGLITCHHTGEPKNLSYSRRRYCALLGCLLSSQVEAILQRREVLKRLKMETEVSAAKESLVMLDMKCAPWDTLYKLFPGWAKIMNCVMLCTEDRSYAYGLTGKSVNQIVSWVRTHVKDADSFVCECIKDIGLTSEDGLCCGFMYIRLKDATYAGLYFFRNEYIKSIIWGGEPKTPDAQGNLNPRVSFSSYKEVMRGRSLRWDSIFVEYAIQIQSIMTRYLFRWKAERHRVDAEREREEVERLMRENEITRQAAVMHNNFLATVSHELRTPIHSILGNTERLIDAQKMNGEAKHACSMIRSSSEHLLAIISDILDLSKLESSRLDIHPIPFDFYKKMEGISQSLFAVAKNKGLYINLLIPIGVPLLMADATRVGQIILNYISNAVKFTTEGGITIKVEQIGRTKSSIDLNFSVMDTGMGINEDDKTKLFQRFSQLENGRARKYDGTGLGLSINKQLAGLMGGEVKVESEHGKGSTFSVKLSMAFVNGQSNMHPLSTISQIEKQSKVILFDSRPFVRDFIDWYNQQWNVDTIVVSSPEEAESKFSSDTMAFIMSIAEADASTYKRLHEKLEKDFPEATSIVVESADMPLVDDLGTHVPILMQPMSPTAYHAMLTKSSNHITPDEPGEHDRRAVIRTDGSVTFEQESTESEDVGKLQLLMAEDNKINQMIAQTFLKSLGHAVKIVDNGDLAVRAAAEEKFDVILMDVMMPVMDGITATVNIRAAEAAKGDGDYTPIVALTAAGESSLREECIGSGMDDCLFKPFRKMDLQKMLVKVVKDYRAQKG